MASRTRQAAGEVRIDDEFERLARELQGQVEPITERYVELVKETAPEWVLSDPVGMRLMAEFGRERISAALLAQVGANIPDSAPGIDTAVAREAARLGLGIDIMLGAYRAGHRAIWEAMLGLIEERVSAPEVRRALLERTSRYGFDYTDRISRFAIEAYEQGREEATRSRDQRRMHAVRELLDGADVDAAALDWPLDHHHLAVFAWGEGADADVRELAAALERPALIVRPTEGWWGWLSSAKPLTAAESRRLRDWEPGGGRMTIGLEAQGPDGFRRSHSQAIRMRWVAESSEARFLRFEEVALEILAGELREDADAFVAHELGDLNADTPKAERLRETLEAYFAAGHNAAAAAAALGVHQQTVGNRISAIEDALGAAVESRRAELETALRLRRCFRGGPDLQDDVQDGPAAG